MYEVFRRERRGSSFEHAGSLPAPDLRFAQLYARDLYGRRGESQALWLVPREAITEIGDFPQEPDAAYRRVDGYSLKERLKEARRRAGQGRP